MEFIELQATIRKETGNGPSRVLRRAGRIPAILYGPKTDPVMLSVGVKDLEQILKNRKFGQIFLNLVIQNGPYATKSAIVKEFQTHPVTGKYIHIDFYEISMDRKIKVKVPVVTKGRSQGVEFGGMLQVIRRDLEILCLPTQMPESIEIDISNLQMGESIHVNDITLMDGIEIVADDDVTVVTILSPKAEKVKSEEGEEGAETEEEVESGGK